MSDRLAVLPQYLIPKQALTVLAGKLASAEAGSLTTTRHPLVRRPLRREHERGGRTRTSPATRASTNSSPARSRPAPARWPTPTSSARWMARSASSAPSSATRSSRPRATAIRPRALVGGDRDLAAQFEDGEFATLYLSPRDYHRIHMPCDGRLTRMIYVPGALFSVNPTTARGVPGLFARNERVVCVFEGGYRPLRAGPGGRHHRRQHGHRLARPRQSAASGRRREWRYDEQNMS